MSHMWAYLAKDAMNSLDLDDLLNTINSLSVQQLCTLLRRNQNRLDNRAESNQQHLGGRARVLSGDECAAICRELCMRCRKDGAWDQSQSDYHNMFQGNPIDIDMHICCQLMIYRRMQINNARRAQLEQQFAVEEESAAADTTAAAETIAAVIRVLELHAGHRGACAAAIGLLGVLANSEERVTEWDYERLAGLLCGAVHHHVEDHDVSLYVARLANRLAFWGTADIHEKLDARMRDLWFSILNRFGTSAEICKWVGYAVGHTMMSLDARARVANKFPLIPFGMRGLHEKLAEALQCHALDAETCAGLCCAMAKMAGAHHQHKVAFKGVKRLPAAVEQALDNHIANPRAVYHLACAITALIGSPIVSNENLPLGLQFGRESRLNELLVAAWHSYYADDDMLDAILLAIGTLVDGDRNMIEKFMEHRDFMQIVQHAALHQTFEIVATGSKLISAAVRLDMEWGRQMTCKGRVQRHLIALLGANDTPSIERNRVIAAVRVLQACG